MVLKVFKRFNSEESKWFNTMRFIKGNLEGSDGSIAKEFRRLSKRNDKDSIKGSIRENQIGSIKGKTLM